MIKHKSFKHGWFYHYRVHEAKTAQLCRNGFGSLQQYLVEMFNGCPDEKFSVGPRSSSLRFPVKAAVKEASGHEVCSLARAGLAWGRYKTGHSNVQVFMLEQDAKSLAVEVPLWMDEREHSFMGHFTEPGPLTGHIDVLRVEDGKVVVWDYKPKAAKEKYASTQTYAYALMLAQRTGIPLTKFRCGWFDEQDAYLFQPK